MSVAPSKADISELSQSLSKRKQMHGDINQEGPKKLEVNQMKV